MEPTRRRPIRELADSADTLSAGASLPGVDPDPVRQHTSEAGDGIGRQLRELESATDQCWLVPGASRRDVRRLVIARVLERVYR